MSERAAVLGVVKRLRAIYADTDGTYVGFQPNMIPPFASGQWYISVGMCSSARGPAQSGDVNDRVYTMQVCITRKVAYVPHDRMGAELAQLDTLQDFAGPATPTEQTPPGIMEMADDICGALIEDYKTVNDCDTFLGVDEESFVEPFHQCSLGQPDVRQMSWSGGASGSSPAELTEVIMLTFSGLRRIRVKTQVA